ncbi:MAG: choice-of-anchor D domain-containing protein [Verrucomicrobiia bacterium]
MKFSVSRWCVLIVLAGVILGVHSQASPVLPHGNKKVIVYPTGTETIDQLTQQGITDVRNYGTYWLVEATEAQAAELTRLYGPRAVEANDLNRIRLRNSSFYTTEGDPTVPADLRQEEPTGRRLRLIQFRGPVVPQWLRQVQSIGGVELIAYVPNDAYLIRLDQPAENRLRALMGSDGPIQWLGAYHPFYKIEPRFLANLDQKDHSLVDVRIMVAPHSEASDTMKAIKKIGLVQQSYNRANLTTLFMTVPIATISQMAKLPDVVWIEKKDPKRLLDEVQDLVLAGQTNGFWHGPEGATTGYTNYLAFLFAQVAGNQTEAFENPLNYPVVDVADTGIDSGPLGGTVITNGNKVITVDPPVHPAFHWFGDATQFSRIVYFAPPWLAGDPELQLGCPDVYLNQNAFNHIESMDLLGHGTAVASIIAGYDDGTNIFLQPCLQLHTATNTWLVPFPGTSITDTNTGEVVPITNPVDCSENATLTFELPTGFSETCGPTNSPPNATFTNVVFVISTNSCPTNAYVDVVYTSIVTNRFTSLRRDDDGNLLGMGVSPFGLLGDSRIWQNYSLDLKVSGTGSASFGQGEVISVGCGPPAPVFLVDTHECINDLPSLLAIAYDANQDSYGPYGARIQNDSWADNLGVPPTAGGQYDADCVSYDIGVRDANLVGQSNNVPGPSALNQEFIVVFACASSLYDAGQEGNAGGFNDIFVTAPATAKNVISVGCADNPRYATVNNVYQCVGGDSLDMASFAAAGPTLDGRFKPEIVAPGYAVYGAIPQLVAVTTNCSIEGLFPTYPDIVACTNPPCNGTQGPIYTDLYGCVAGSSYAAPAVSGAIQLLWWYFQNRLTTELGTALYQPSPAMAKAYLCNSARYLPITDASSGAMDTLPSTLQGMGELDLGRMFDGVPRAIRDESSPRAIDVALTTTNPASQQTYFSASGQSYQMSGQIASNGLPFRVTLAWLDAPGVPFTTPELVNGLDLEVTVGGVTYYGNVFKENVSVPGGTFDSINNMQSVFLNPTSWPNGITAVTAGAPFQVKVLAQNIAGNGVPNVGEPTPGGSNTLNQDFALVVYNAKANTLSDVPNPATNNDCQTALVVDNFPYTFVNTLNTTTYHQPFPSPTAGSGGSEEFFRIPLPTPGVTFTVDTSLSFFPNILSVWEVQVVPQTIYVRGDCGALTELISTNGSHLSFTSDGTNDYFIVVEPAGGGAGGTMVLNVDAAQVPITITPSPVSFGNWVAGTISTSQVVSYFNGTTVPVNVQNVSITGSNAADFTIIANGCQGESLSPGFGCNVSVEFAPAISDVGLLQANLVFTDNATGSPRSIPMTGTSTTPSPLLCPSTTGPLVFSNQLVGTSSAVQSITLTNCGSTVLNVSNVTVSGTASLDFSVSQNCTNAGIAPGGMCTVQVTFTPTKSGTRAATLVMAGNVAGSPVTVTLQGVGVIAAPAICFSSSSLNFGSFGIDSTSAVQNLTITNCGTAALVITNAAVTAGDVSDFSVVSNTCTNMAPGATCTVGVGFAPKTGGARSATLAIADNVTGSPQLITLTGSGSVNQPDAAIGKTTNLKKMVGFGVITNVFSGTEGILQDVRPGAKKGVTFYVAVKNVGTGPDQYSVQGQQVTGGAGFTANYFLGSSSNPSESFDVTAAVVAGAFTTSTMEATAVTGDSSMLRVVITADKTVTRSSQATFTLTFTSANDTTKQDTVTAGVLAK